LTKQSLNQVLDEHPLSLFQLVTILICGTIGLLDGFDMQSIAFVAPAVIREWAMAPSSFAPIFVAGGIGSLLASLPFGSVADRYGRRRCLLIVTAIAAAGTLATPFAANREQLLACRLVSSFGLGGMLPTLVALTAEYAPRRLRGLIVTATFCSFPLGAVLGGVISGVLLQDHDWRTVFWLGGLVTFLLLPVIAFRLPESPSWLARRGRTAEVAWIVGRMGRTATWDGRVAAPRQRERSGEGVLHVAREGRATVTLLLGLAFFVSLLLTFLMVNWVPTLAVRSGSTIRQGAFASALLNLAGIAGGLVISRIADRRTPHAVVASAYLLGALSVLTLSSVTYLASTIFLFTFVTGFFCIGAQVTLVSLASAYYPVEVRSSGVAVVSGMGRLGAIAGPLIGGVLIDGSNLGRALGWVVGGSALVAAAAVWLVHRRASLPKQRAVPST